jgi:hypothetical protein
MRKVLALVIGVLFLASCGPKRMGCGPYRCETKVSNNINKVNV